MGEDAGDDPGGARGDPALISYDQGVWAPATRQRYEELTYLERLWLAARPGAELVAA